MYPEFDLFGLKLHTFGLMFALGFLVAGALVWRRLREFGRPGDWAYEIAFSAMIGGVVGARVWFLIEDWDHTKHDVIGTIFSGSGLVWYGGAVGGAICVALWRLWRKLPFIQLADITAVPLAVGYAIGRIGCQLSGDGDYGKVTGTPWSMAYPNGTVPTDMKVEPTPVEETLAMGTFAYVMWRLRDRFRTGTLFGIYLIGAGVERFLIEYIRHNARDVLGLTVAQVTSIAMVAAGTIWLICLRYWYARRPPQPPAPKVTRKPQVTHAKH